LLAALVERIAYRPLRSSHPMMPIMAAIAAGIILRQVVVFVWGVQTQSFPQLLPVPYNLGNLQISGPRSSRSSWQSAARSGSAYSSIAPDGAAPSSLCARTSKSRASWVSRSTKW